MATQFFDALGFGGSFRHSVSETL